MGIADVKVFSAEEADYLVSAADGSERGGSSGGSTSKCGTPASP